MPDIQTLANLAAEKIRGGYNAPHAARSALKELDIPAEEQERLFHDILSELSRRSRARRKKNKTKKIKGNKPFDTSSLGQDENALSSCSSLAVIKMVTACVHATRLHFLYKELCHPNGQAPYLSQCLCLRCD